MSATSPKPRRVDVWDIRQEFNRQGFDGLIASNQAMLIINRIGVPKPENKQPPGTKSVTAWIYNRKLQLLAFVHYYEHPDGTKTPMDPKSLVVGRELWKPR